MITNKTDEETSEKVFTGVELESEEPTRPDGEAEPEAGPEHQLNPEGAGPARPEDIKDLQPTKYISSHDIEHLKMQYGCKLYMFAIDDERAFIIRPLKRSEYIQITNQVTTSGFTPLKEEEEFVKRCLCWPQEAADIDHWSSLEAGVATFLYNYIRFISGFITVEQAYAYNMLAEL